MLFALTLTVPLNVCPNLRFFVHLTAFPPRRFYIYLHISCHMHNLLNLGQKFSLVLIWSDLKLINFFKKCLSSLLLNESQTWAVNPCSSSSYSFLSTPKQKKPVNYVVAFDFRGMDTSWSTVRHVDQSGISLVASLLLSVASSLLSWKTVSFLRTTSFSLKCTLRIHCRLCSGHLVNCFLLRWNQRFQHSITGNTVVTSCIANAFFLSKHTMSSLNSARGKTLHSYLQQFISWIIPSSSLAL